MTVRSLEEFVVDKSLLYLFVAGPGTGEGIAVRLPQDLGWLAVDGCRAAERAHYSLEAILERWGGDARLRFFAFTHPHADHAEGIPELLECFPPDCVGVPGIDDPENHLVAEAERVRSSSSSPKENRVHAALRAIQRQACDLRILRDGIEPQTWGDVTMRVLAPTHDEYRAWEATKKPPLGKGANRVSAVLVIEFGEARIVLAGDKEEGWDELVRKYPEVGDHSALKVPHHGSRDALHNGIITSPSSKPSRAWLLTPFGRSGLPRADADDGLDYLLEAQSPLLLTALSMSTRLQTARTIRAVTREDLSQQRETLRKRRTFSAQDIVLEPASALGPLDAVWCVGIDHDGVVRERWAGDGAMEVHRSDT